MVTEIQDKVVLQGRGVMEGIVTGKVRHIHVPLRNQERRNFEFPSDLGDADILITEMTTLEMMGIILSVKAVVTRVGGTLCHAAICAREYGIPTVVACKGANSYAIPDGSIVTVDGIAGTVTIEQLGEG